MKYKFIENESVENEYEVYLDEDLLCHISFCDVDRFLKTLSVGCVIELSKAV